MFTIIISFLYRLWFFNRQLLQNIYNLALKGWTWLVALIVVIMGCWKKLIDSIYMLFQQLIDALAGLVMPEHSVTQSVGDFFSVINHFFPLEEMFALMTLLSATWLIMLLYRTIKSWIPTLD